MKKFEEVSGAQIIEGYGLSETSNILTANPPARRKPGSVGVPWPDVDIRIVDLETGTKEMPAGEAGEIIAKGPQIMTGYWNNPTETAKALRDGWLFTGDIGSMDKDGYVFILDRKKDMLICSGFNVYPREIDEVLYANPKVSEACAIGVPDEKRGETVKAFVVLKAGETFTCEELVEYCQERLAPYKVPKIVEFIDQLPRTPFGKPDRRALRAIDEAKRGQVHA
jgi:long-chain acyl-CoA synthetase